MKKLVIFLGFLFITIYSVQAQTYTGCVLVNNGGLELPLITPVYSTPTGATVPNTTLYCNPNNTVGTTIPVYGSPIAGSIPGLRCFSTSINPPYTYRNCYVSGSCGIIMSVTIISCPIDSYVWLICFIIGIIGFISIKKEIT
ncbi:hypothetical protein [Pedobacter nototheniae]|uniref:hypothetical protein n=1 Tax=Pedobacter nototheniae TaxID=2488994 RepID=UPI00103F6D60|nr:MULTISPECIES: hypothetical protein [Pedobacter]